MHTKRRSIGSVVFLTGPISYFCFLILFFSAFLRVQPFSNTLLLVVYLLHAVSLLVEIIVLHNF